MVPGSGLRGPPLLAREEPGTDTPVGRDTPPVAPSSSQPRWHVRPEIATRPVHATGNAECPSFDPGGRGGRAESQRSLSREAREACVTARPGPRGGRGPGQARGGVRSQTPDSRFLALEGRGQVTSPDSLCFRVSQMGGPCPVAMLTGPRGTCLEPNVPLTGVNGVTRVGARPASCLVQDPGLWRAQAAASLPPRPAGSPQSSPLPLPLRGPKDKGTHQPQRFSLSLCKAGENERMSSAAI